MKKNVLTVVAAALILANLTGCNNSDETPDSKNNISSTESTDSASQPENSAEDENSSTESSTQSTPESVPEPVPMEFTDEDRELQKMLPAITEPASSIYGVINGIDVAMNDNYKFKFADFDDSEIIYDYYSLSNRYLIENTKFPETCSEMEKLLLRYFSEDRTKDVMMKQFSVYEIIDISDNIYTLKSLAEKTPSYRTMFVEADGKLYRFDVIGFRGIPIDYDSVKITSKTDNMIEFTYLPSNDWERTPDNAACLTDVYLYSEHALKCVLKYERGGWKFDSWELE